MVIGMGSLHNQTHLKENRKDLRSNFTAAEATLWTCLQGRQLEGRKFRRQHSIGNYIVDYYCPQERLVVELDGEYNFTSNGFAEDKLRDAYLEELNIRVIRFENSEVFDNIEYVLERISDLFTTPSPS